MSLMVSVSGVRGVVGESLHPSVLLKYISGFVTLMRIKQPVPKIIVGRDTRPTGFAIQGFIQSALVQFGCNVIDIGIAATPTVAIAIEEEQATGGICITASHNPIEWNALKFFNELGEFLTDTESNFVYEHADTSLASVSWNNYGMLITKKEYDDIHIQKILQLPYINKKTIESKSLKVVVDAVNGAGAELVPNLLQALGIRNIEKIACKPTGIFPRNPEPIEENLLETMGMVKYYGGDIGVVVDPDVDRVCFVCEDGTLFGEEYSLVACASFYLNHKKGNVVNNLSSSRALKDIAEKQGVICYSAKVGEANVVKVMKETHAVIGGEGSGGIILPEVHYGRDALVGIALFLQAFAEWRVSSEKTLSQFKKEFPQYYMEKDKVKIADEEKFAKTIEEIKNEFHDAKITTIDGLKIDFKTAWVHIRKSNTEPIVRIYIEAKTKTEAMILMEMFKARVGAV